MPRLPLRPLAATLLIASSLLVVACGDDKENDWQGKTIAIGSIFSTTGDGIAFGPQQLRAAQLAVDSVNKEGGIDGATLELKQRDDRSNPASSAKQMNALIQDDEVLAVMGPTFSNSAAEADPVANDAKTPVLAVSNTGPGIVGECPYACDYIFRDSLGEADAIPANIQTLVAETAPKTAAILHPEADPFGETTAGIARDAFEAEGVKVTSTAAYPAGKELILQSQPAVVMITASSGQAAAEIINNLRNNGFKGSIVGGNAFNSALASTVAGNNGKGAQSAAAWYAGNDSDENREFVFDYKAAYDQEPDQFAAQAYSGVMLLAEAADDADLKFEDVAQDREALKSALESVDEETPLGDFSFTPDHDVSQPIWIVKMNGKGGYELVKEIPAK